MEDVLNPKVDLSTYLAIAQELIKDSPKFYSKKEQNGILSFAKYLDSGREIGPEFQLLAMKKAQQIDREVLLACAEEFGKDKMAEIIRSVYAKHQNRRVS